MKWLVGLVLGVVGLIAFGEILTVARNTLFHGEHPPVTTVQRGPRGSGLVLLYSPERLEEKVAANQIPHSVPYAGNDGPKAGEVYENIKVLGDVGIGEFTRLMVNMTTWVAPTQGCSACHDVANFASDGLYTKVVARRMLEMVRHVNGNWTAHVAKTGVTCYTCHRGRLVPPNVWFNNPGPHQAGGVAQAPTGQNHPALISGTTSLPLDPLTPFLEGSSDVRIQGTTPLRGTNRHSIKQAEWTYALMMHISQALGVNCDYCHNTRALANWQQSSPQRVTAWHGIRMVRDLNNNYLNPLRDTLPPQRLGPALGDSPKVNCATCHNGVYKPLFGVSMVQDFPELKGAQAE